MLTGGRLLGKKKNGREDPAPQISKVGWINTKRQRYTAASCKQKKKKNGRRLNDQTIKRPRRSRAQRDQTPWDTVSRILESQLPKTRTWSHLITGPRTRWAKSEGAEKGRKDKLRKNPHTKMASSNGLKTGVRRLTRKGDLLETSWKEMGRKLKSTEPDEKEQRRHAQAWRKKRLCWVKKEEVVCGKG